MGNLEMDKFINIEYLAEGGFGSIWKAEWINMPEEIFEFYKSNQVALKKLKNSQEISSEFLKRICNSFMIYENGNLRDFLNQNKSLPWIERLCYSFIRGLKVIHSKGFIHHDLHPGNLMITEAYSNSKYIRLGDLGLCRLANETSSSGAYGKKPFANRAYDSELAFDIFNGLRLKTNKDTPQCYIELMELCWHKYPSKHPSSETIYYASEKWIGDLLYDEKSADSLMFLNPNHKMHDLSEGGDLTSETTHSEAYITSKLLPSYFNNLHIDDLNFDGC
ncbi:hypothetical protein Glove_692g13 [Diversispora epigaea]|uniref:Protein kinase domain-containing protein n=1 Tax=Diversispora epigaea TaxID=1348612 RepID=A0A397G1Z8_9GLOM|nr:hypothetical protein Glove_692g13 [Diversispora epigaea]